MAKSKKRIPNLNKTVADIQDLVNQPGYLYSLLTIALHDLFLPLENYLNVNWLDRISYQELGYLFGLLAKKPLSTEVYPSQDDAEKQINDTYELLSRLHNYYSLTAFDGMIEAALKAKKETGKTPPTKDRFYTTPEAVIESIFYDDSGAYDFQYWDTALYRYAKDDKWLKHQFGFSIKDAIEVSKQLKELTEKKYRNAKIPKSAREFNDWILSVFSFKESDIKNLTEAKRKVLNKLSVIPGKSNKSFNLISDFNETVVRPLIKLSSSSYLLPISFDLSRSVDESPFYWMKEADEQYFLSTATKNRGKYTEKAAFDLLVKVFGKDKVFLDARVHRKKGQGIKKKGKYHTDIDVLVLLGNKAIILQAKSKKLTLPSRYGNIKQLGADFRNAVQDAYDQGLKARKEILTRNAIITESNGKKIQLSEALDEVYIITLTTDNYPALAFQIHNFLDKQETDPFPVAVNLYDLDLLTQYLTDPFDFLFYINQRISLSPVIFGSSEIACLGYHLTQKLFINPKDKPDKLHITPDFGQYIDDDVMRQRYGSDADKRKSKIRQKWKNESFIKLVEQIKSSKVPGLTDTIFFLFNLSSDTADRLLEMMEKQKAQAIQDNKPHSMAVPIDSGMGGITYIVEPDTTHNLNDHLMAYSEARKYKTKANQWLALGSYATSSNLIDMVAFSKEPWRPNPRLEKLASVMLKPGQVIARKIGRNDPCYCGSGKKYKKCHYLLEH